METLCRTIVLDWTKEPEYASASVLMIAEDVWTPGCEGMESYRAEFAT